MTDSAARRTEVELATMGDQLLALYAAVQRDTHALHQASIEANAEELRTFLDDRSAQLRVADALLAALGPDVERLQPGQRDRLIGALQSVMQQDGALEAALSAHAQMISAQLGRVRGSRVRLGNYRRGAPDTPTVVDRRG